MNRIIFLGSKKLAREEILHVIYSGHSVMKWEIVILYVITIIDARI